MVHLITVIRAVDQLTDIIPIVGNVKNLGIYLYQQCYKVDETANPVTTATVSWVDDFKINALSKDLTTWNLIPILGEITFIFHYFVKIISSCYLNEPTDLLSEIIREHRTPRHYEVVILELARRPRKILDLESNKLPYPGQRGIDLKFDGSSCHIIALPPLPTPSCLDLLSKAPFEIMEKILSNAEDLKEDAETVAVSLCRLLDYFESNENQERVIRFLSKIKKERPDLYIPIVRKGLERWISPKEERFLTERSFLNRWVE